MYATVFNQWKDLAGEIEKVVAASEEGAWPDLIELLRSPLGKSFESNLASLERLTFVHTNEQLHRLRIMSYAVMIVMAFFVFGFLSFLIVGRERLHGEQRVRRLTQSLLKRLEDERKQMSFDLHDVLFQDLASVKMKCQNMLEDAREDIQVGQEQLEAVVGELQELIRVTRGITGTMKPKRLEHFGLAGGIRALCNDISTHTDLDIRFFAVGLEAVDIEFDTEINLYRVTQEFLRHVRLYSEADRISVRLIASSPKLYLRIHDNGNGINPFKKRRAEAASPDEQLRLITIEERVRMLNGEITVESAPGKGTEYKIGVPLRRSETAAEAAASG
jgi:signal transduction histidine kinase